MMLWLELFILLVCILIGARLGGIAHGTVAGTDQASMGMAIIIVMIAMALPLSSVLPF